MLFLCIVTDTAHAINTLCCVNQDRYSNGCWMIFCAKKGCNVVPQAMHAVFLSHVVTHLDTWWFKQHDRSSVLCCCNQQSHRFDTILSIRTLPGLDIGTPEMHSAIIREAESTDIAIAIKHMLVLVVTPLKPARTAL